MEYEVVRKNIKNMYLRVKPPDGRIVVSAPRRVSLATIDAFVRSRADWIARQRARQSRRPDLIDDDLAEATTVTLWGTTYPLTIVEGPTFRLTVADGRATFMVRTQSSPEVRQRQWREALRQLFAAEVARRKDFWQAHCGLQAAEWRTKFMKTRWGTCSIQARRIWLNVRLIHYPPECLDYVIVHELVHLRERTHGPAFQLLMDAYYPDWRRVKRLLSG